MVVGGGGWWWVVVYGGTVYNNPFFCSINLTFIFMHILDVSCESTKSFKGTLMQI